MVQYKAITKGLDVEKIAQELEQSTETLKRGVLIGLAETIADNSVNTVDTGTYARSHRIRLRSGSFKPTVSSHNKPKEANKRKAADEGLAQMLADIESIDLSKDTFAIRNEAIHAYRVESQGWQGIEKNKGPYRVYQRARNEVNNIISKAVAEAKART